MAYCVGHDEINALFPFCESRIMKMSEHKDPSPPPSPMMNLGCIIGVEVVVT